MSEWWRYLDCGGNDAALAVFRMKQAKAVSALRSATAVQNGEQRQTGMFLPPFEEADRNLCPTLEEAGRNVCPHWGARCGVREREAILLGVTGWFFP